ncbi:bacteriocin immunity protein [Streptomyces sp. KM273126]|nr:bacteriocin immunity protein [Streptomyces sp. KM273126]
MSRVELVALVERIMGGEGAEDEHGRLVEALENNVPHPRVLDLIFHPHLDGFQEAQLTAEQIVDAALSYEPIEL